MKIRNLLLIVALLLISLMLSAFVPARAPTPPASDIDWSGFFSTLIQAAILAAISFIVPAVRAWLKSQTDAALARIESYSPDLMSSLREAASIAVQAAEQYKLVDKLLVKKDYAVDIAQQWLAARGVKIDLKLIEAAIEAQVGIYYPHENKPTPEGASPAELKQK